MSRWVYDWVWKLIHEHWRWGLTELKVHLQVELFVLQVMVFISASYIWSMEGICRIVTYRGKTAFSYMKVSPCSDSWDKLLIINISHVSHLHQRFFFIISLIWDKMCSVHENIWTSFIVNIQHSIHLLHSVGNRDREKNDALLCNRLIENRHTSV